MRLTKEEYQLLDEEKKSEYGLVVQGWMSGKYLDVAEPYKDLAELQKKYPYGYFVETYELGYRSKFLKQSIALDVCKLDWEYIQAGGDSSYQDELDKVVERLMELPQKSAIRLLLKVIEAQQLTSKYPYEDSPFKDMLEFKYLE